MSRGKWGWKTRLKHIEEVCYMMANLDDMPTWDTLTLDEAIAMVKDVINTHDEDNGDWDNPQERTDYNRAVRWLDEFGGKPIEKAKRTILPRTSSYKTYVIVYQDGYDNGITKHTNLPGRNAQEAADAFRLHFDSENIIITIARVVCNWE